MVTQKERRYSIFTLILFLVLLLTGCGEEPVSEETGAAMAQTTASQEAVGTMTVHYMDVGQGDSTLIICDGEAMLIDAGDNDKGTLVQSYLNSQQVKQLRYVVGTHPDADHVGGLDVIIYKFDCDTIFLEDEGGDTRTYEDVLDTIEAKGYKSTDPDVGEEYSLGSASFTIVAPEASYTDSNENSIGILLTHGENTFLFTGDAEEAAEGAMVQSSLSLRADVYKVGHHGSRSSSSPAFLDAVAPVYGVISCGENNSYGHPHSQTLNQLRERGVQVFRTDEEGTIVATSDGKNLTFNVPPSETWQQGEGAQTSGAPVVPKAGSGAEVTDGYVLNTNSMKFHLPDCNSVQSMSEKNKDTSEESRDVLIAKGYAPCGNCHP